MRNLARNPSVSFCDRPLTFWAPSLRTIFCTLIFRHIFPIHNVTINSNNLFVNFRSTFTFALRNLMTERASPLAGLWIGSAISNTSHLKPVLPLSNEHGSQVKDQGRRQCCHNKHKNFSIGLHVMYLYFPDTPRILIFVCFLCFVFFVLFLLLCCLFPVFVQVYRPLPPGGHPVAVNKYHIKNQLYLIPKQFNARAFMLQLYIMSTLRLRNVNVHFFYF